MLWCTEFYYYRNTFVVIRTHLIYIFLFEALKMWLDMFWFVQSIDNRLKIVSREVFNADKGNSGVEQDEKKNETIRMESENWR